MTWGGFKGRRAARFAGLALLVALPAANAAASEDDSVFSRADPAYAALAALEARANELVRTGTHDARGRVEIVAAWREAQAAAAEFRLADGKPHPLAHAARIHIASQLYADGENAAALDEVRQGLDGLRLYVAQYLLAQAEGVALLGTLLAQGGNAEEALPLVEAGYEDFQREFAAMPEAERGRDVILAKSNLEFSLSQIGLRLSRNDLALRYQLASLETREAFLGPNDPDTVASYYGYAGALRRFERMEEAERYARIAVDRAVEHVDPSHPSYARAFEMLGIVLSRSGRPIEATDYLLRALELKRDYEGTDNLVFGYGIHNLATIFLQRERYGEAAPLFVEAEQLFRDKQGAGSPYAIGSLAYVGQIDFVEGRYADAAARLDQLNDELGETSSDLEISTRILPDLSSALLRLGRNGEAAQAAAALGRQLLDNPQSTAFDLRRAGLLRARAHSAGGSEAMDQSLAMLDLLRRDLHAGSHTSLQSEQRAALDLIMDSGTVASDPELVLQAMSLLSLSDIAEATSLRQRRAEEGDPAFADALRRVQQAEAAVETADRAVLRALAAGDDLAIPRSALASAEVERERAQAALAVAFPGRASAGDGAAASLADLQAGLAADQAYVAVVPAYNGVYLLAVTNDGAVVRRAALGRAAMVALAKRLRGSIDARQFDAGAAQALGAAIFADEIRALIGERQELRIFAAGSLASLPFSLLSWDGVAGNYLIDRFALASASTLNAGNVEGQAGDRLIESFVAFANPSFGSPASAAGDVTRGAPGAIAGFFGRKEPDFDTLARLPPLPETLREAREIAKFFRPDRVMILDGETARESVVRDGAVSQADVILFATHGLIAGEIEGIAEPALVLALDRTATGGTDGLLTASEIEKLDLSADWVILSACDSAAGMDAGLPAFSGLARAFRFAGANDLLVSHWKVRDDVAAFVTVEALKHYRQHGSKPAALRQAILKLRRESGLAGSNRPETWAPFVLLES